jgi:hypothetical protein
MQLSQTGAFDALSDRNGKDQPTLSGREQLGAMEVVRHAWDRIFIAIARWVASFAGDTARRVVPAQVQRLHADVAALRTCVRCAPRTLVLALEYAEDRRFRLHAGVDPMAVVRAAWRRATSGRIEGGSTIEQQLVRTLTGRREKTLRRKLLEMGLAATLRTLFTKDTLASIYLDVAYFGWRMNGLDQALRRLGAAGDSVDLDTACAIVARLKVPQPAHPSPEWWRRVRLRERHIACLLSRKDVP